MTIPNLWKLPSTQQGNAISAAESNRDRRELEGESDTPTTFKPLLFTAGAPSEDALNESINTFLGHRDKFKLSGPPYGTQRSAFGEPPMIWRTYGIADSLHSVIFNAPTQTPAEPSKSKILVFTFGGTGPQYWNQGRSLMAACPVFRDSIYECDRIYSDYTGKSYLEETGLFFPEAPQGAYLEHADAWPGDVTCLANVFFQVAMYDQLLSHNISPDVVTGFSLGETTALYASGTVTRDMVIKLGTAVGRAVGRLDNTGGLVVAVIGVPNQTVIDAIRSIPLKEIADNLEISSFITPTITGVVGLNTHVEYFTQNHLPEGAQFVRIHVGSAVHSPYLDISENEYRREVEAVFAENPGLSLIPQIPMMSSVTGKYKTDAVTVDYLWDSVRRRILMSPAVQNILDEYGDRATFIEFSPHPSLSPYIEGMGASASFGPSARPPSKRQILAGAKEVTEIEGYLNACGRLFTSGIDSMNPSSVNPSYFSGNGVRE